jgi:hypothetical protein
VRRINYSVDAAPDGRYDFLLKDEPLYCKSLPGTPLELRQELARGLWLVLVFAVWSGPDREAVQTALSAVKLFGGRVQLGLRAFDRHEEVRALWPHVKESLGSPIWLILRDGKLLEEHVGAFSRRVVTNWLRQVLRHEPSQAG